MKNTISYSSPALETYIKDKNVIPYSMSPNDKMIRSKWYFDSAYGYLIKIIEVQYTNGMLDHAITRSIEGYQSYIITPLNYRSDYYIEFDAEKIFKKDIINSESSYTGAEIRYWFFKNNITAFDKKYINFWKYVDSYSPDKIDDRMKYFIQASVDKEGNYIDCKFLKDFKKKIYTPKEINRFNKYMGDLKTKDYHNTIKYHENKNKESQS